MRYEREICPNCFDTEYGQGECAKCGYRESYETRSARALQAGTILNGRYIVGRVLGEGGFGITYKACDVEGGGLCAIKEYAPAADSERQADGLTLRTASGRDPARYEKGLKRFMEEAQVLHRLGEMPNVVRIFDLFQENHTAYFAMELLEGANLNQIVQAARGVLPFKEITSIIVQVGMALAQIHEQAGIFHRDISPENIYVTRDGQVKLIDFGNAKELTRQKDQEYSVVLKPSFAPPEQHSSRMQQGSYTDVYSLAGTYYFALTGIRLPSAVERLTGETYIPLKQMNLGIPEAVSDVVDQALVLDCRRRTQTMREFVEGILKSERMAAVKGPEPPAQSPYLEILAGEMRGAVWQIPSNVEIKVGRSAARCDIAIAGHSDVSKEHLKIYYDGQKGLFYIRDMSRFGTYINGIRLEQGTVFSARPPVNIALASQACVLRAAGEPAGAGRR